MENPPPPHTDVEIGYRPNIGVSHGNLVWAVTIWSILENEGFYYPSVAGVDQDQGWSAGLLWRWVPLRYGRKFMSMIHA